MKYCGFCGSQIAEDAVFCGRCGAKCFGDAFEKSNTQGKREEKVQEVGDTVLYNRTPTNTTKPYIAQRSAFHNTNDAIVDEDVKSTSEFVSYFKNLFTKSNMGIIIWMSINLLFICVLSVVTAVGVGNNNVAGVVFGIILGLGLYLLSIWVALSDFGEMIVRLQNGCKEINDPDIMSRLEPVFEEVYHRAKHRNPELPDDIQLYIADDDSENAFACGRKTLCIATGILKRSDDEIKGVLGHEFGHLARKDTYNTQIILIGNLIFSFLYTIVRFIAKIYMFIMRIIVDIIVALSSSSVIVRGISWAITGITKFIVDVLLIVFMAVWTRIGVAICAASSRTNEYLADEYSYRLGYGYELRSVLESWPSESRFSKSVFAILGSSHPATEDRINRLNELLND